MVKARPSCWAKLAIWVVSDAKAARAFIDAACGSPSTKYTEPNADSHSNEVMEIVLDSSLGALAAKESIDVLQADLDSCVTSGNADTASVHCDSAADACASHELHVDAGDGVAVDTAAVGVVEDGVPAVEQAVTVTQKAPAAIAAPVARAVCMSLDRRAILTSYLTSDSVRGTGGARWVTPLGVTQVALAPYPRVNVAVPI